MRTVGTIAACLVVVAGCTPAPRSAKLRVIVPPFDDAPVSFVVAGPRFSPGEVTIVKVCLAPDRSIISVNLLASSGDRRFDDMALNWARQVKLRSAPAPAGALMLRCGEVRVEIHQPTEPRVIEGPDNSLS
ncbi:MAG TPA: hypothetical protein VGF89_03505 [Steroidobacteraceae bacterium]